jgi:hypothetical protein
VVASALNPQAVEAGNDGANGMLGYALAVTHRAPP